MVIDIMRANETPKEKNAEFVNMKLRAKPGKILREPKIKKKTDEIGTGPMDGPESERLPTL